MIPTKNFLTTGLQRLTALAMLALLALLWSAVAWNQQDVERRELDDIRRETATLTLLFANDADIIFRSVDLALQQVRSTWASHPINMGEVTDKKFNRIRPSMALKSVPKSRTFPDVKN